MKRLLSLCFLLALSAPVLADDLRDFTTDGCSLFPDGTPMQQELWCDCCVQHDMAYWRGGTEAERRAADKALEQCVRQRTGNKPLAELVYTGVRSGGHPVFPTWYRWGYGWKYGRGYVALSAEEKAAAQMKLAEWQANHPDVTCVVPQPELKATSKSVAPPAGAGNK